MNFQQAEYEEFVSTIPANLAWMFGMVIAARKILSKTLFMKKNFDYKKMLTLMY